MRRILLSAVVLMAAWVLVADSASAGWRRWAYCGCYDGCYSSCYGCNSCYTGCNSCGYSCNSCGYDSCNSCNTCNTCNTGCNGCVTQQAPAAETPKAPPANR